jgi:putative tricarboxylic transport membrane protein
VRASGDRAIGAAGVLLGLAAAAEGWRLPAATETGEPGTRLFPIVLGSLIALLSALVVLRPAGPSASSPAADPSGTSRLWSTVAVLVAYAVAFERLGFPLATPLALGALLAGYGERRWAVLAGVSLGITAATYLVFARWLGAPLPLGILGP